MIQTGSEVKAVPEETIKAKRTAKDSVFCDLFDDPEYQLKLYQLLHPEDKSVAVSEFTTVTISDILTDQPYNDLGFIVRDKLLFLVEAQFHMANQYYPKNFDVPCADTERMDRRQEREHIRKQEN